MSESTRHVEIKYFSCSMEEIFPSAKLQNNAVALSDISHLLLDRFQSFKEKIKQTPFKQNMLPFLEKNTYQVCWCSTQHSTQNFTVQLQPSDTQSG